MSLPPPEEPSLLSLPLPHPEAYEGEPREYARALMQRKDDIEKEIDVLTDVLSSHNANASTPLVDNEGYPRADIDVYAIRHARSSLVRLQNDRQAVTELLASALHDAFAPGSSGDQSQPNGGSLGTETVSACQQSNEISPAPPPADQQDIWPSQGVARVNSVAPGSPAFEAGLQAQDIIYSFAGVTYTSPGGLQAIGAVVVQSEGVSISLLVCRGEDRLTLMITPRTGWGGRGSLGCHILPI